MNTASYIAYYHTREYGPLGYLNNQNFKNEIHHATFIAKLFSLLERSNEIFVLHHKNDLDEIYPFWVAIEVITFDMVSKIFSNLLSKDKTSICSENFLRKTSYKLIENWLKCTVISRNISAHGGRFYNRSFPIKILTPKKDNLQFDPGSPFAYIYALYRLLPNNLLRQSMLKDLELLFLRYPFVKLKHLGFPEDWLAILERCLCFPYEFSAPTLKYEALDFSFASIPHKPAPGYNSEDCG